MVNSRSKGKRGELEWARMLRALGFDGARRGQQFKGGPDSPDVVDGIPGTHAEVKRTESFRLWDALHQAAAEANEGDVPYVAHKRNRSQWVVIVNAVDLIEFAQRILGLPASSRKEDPD